MNEHPDPGLYLIVEFEWPADVSRELGQQARALHDLVEGADWIREVVAASGGVGGDLSSIWVFRLADYAALDRLLNTPDDPIGHAYGTFFGAMPQVRDRIRHGVAFA